MGNQDRQTRVEWFAQLASRLGVTLDPDFNLVVETAMERDRCEEIRDAARGYIRACLGNPDEEMPDQELIETAANKLANRTPNGVVLPKQEFQLEFNQLQKAVAGWLGSLGIDDQIYQICLPLLIRVAKGERSAQEESRPYSSSKLHSDLWVGEPLDLIGVRIPVLGDIERTTIEFYQPPENFEDRYLRLMSDYDEGKELQGSSPKYPIRMRHGYAYFMDGSVLHKTAKYGGGARATIQVELRSWTSDSRRKEVEKVSPAGPLSYYIDREEWYEYGTSKFLKPRDTYADAERGIFTERSADEPMYDVVESLS